MKHNSNRKRGRPRQITLAVVRRVAERVGLGVPLNYACLLEDNPQINTESFQRAMQRNPEFVHPYEAAKAAFLEKSFRWFSVHEDWRARVVLLERRHANDFAKPAAVAISVSQSMVVGVPNDVLTRARDYARQQRQIEQRNFDEKES